jgi:hypothetical protein
MLLTICANKPKSKNIYTKFFLSLGVIQIMKLMKHLILVLFIGSIMAIGFNSCLKIEDPEVLPGHKYTYYVRTDGKDVLLTYQDNHGQKHKDTISYGIWHISYDATIGTKTLFMILPTENCNVECYLAQDGRKIHKSNWKQWYRLHGLKCEYTLKELN